MAFVYKLKVSHFRGLENFEQTFSNGITCIIGRGDSGKTSILEAIAAVLHPTYDRRFYDTDFYNCDISKPILIEAVVKNLPDSLASKYGKHIVGISNDEIIEDMESEDAIDSEPALRIKLSVAEDLEPHWVVYSERNDDEMSISATDRAKLNMAYLSDYSDRHFSLMKGTPLYAKNKENDDNEENSDEVLSVLRDAKEKIDVSAGPKFNKTIESLKDSIEKLGIDGSKINARLDQKDFFLKENKLSLHSDLIPLRMNGRGSKRIYSLAIQLAVTKNDSIILIDEIESGLEPDRVRYLVHTLQEDYSNAQIIFTTHSRDVIVELNCNLIRIKRQKESQLHLIKSNMQGSVRACPEALFAKKIIVCEGATEIGFCRALNDWRVMNDKQSLAYIGVCLADGAGNNQIDRVKHFCKLEYDVCLVCDSDESATNDAKANIKCPIFDCDDNLSFEEQIFKDVTWAQVISLVDYRKSMNPNYDDKSILNELNQENENPLSYTPQNWLDTDDPALRKRIGFIAKKNGWYKRIEKAEEVGRIFFNAFNEIQSESRLKKNVKRLCAWIDEKDV